MLTVALAAFSPMQVALDLEALEAQLVELSGCTEGSCKQMGAPVNPKQPEGYYCYRKTIALFGGQITLQLGRGLFGKESLEDLKQVATKFQGPKFLATRVARRFVWF